MVIDQWYIIPLTKRAVFQDHLANCSCFCIYIKVQCADSSRHELFVVMNTVGFDVFPVQKSKLRSHLVFS